MKKFCVILVVLMIICCTMDVSSGFKMDRPRFRDIKGACEWIHDNIEYKKVKGLANPEDTLRRRYGDCGDMSALLMAIVGYQHGNYYTYYVSVKTEHKDITHAVVEYQGKFYDSTKGQIVEIKESDVNYRSDHYQTMWSAYKE